MKELKVRLKDKGYSICIGAGAVALAGARFKALGLSGKILIVTNSTIARYCLKPLLQTLRRAGHAPAVHDALPDSESAKSAPALFGIYSRMVKEGLDRSGTLVALGGGVVGDVTGFAASTYMRGIPWVGVPTTLLAQVDSSIGGKTGINLAQGKNLVGTFHHPRIVISDTDFLQTLPAGELSHALAEVIKYAVIRDARFFRFLEKSIHRAKQRDAGFFERIVYHCARIKRDVVEQDEKEEKEIRAILNYGHTFGHALEAACETWERSIPHGEAVALGMVAAGEMACRKGWFSKQSQLRQMFLIREAGLALRLENRMPVSKILHYMWHDKKKKGGKLRFVLPQAIGRVCVTDSVSKIEIRRALGAILR
ncbi:MAG: 3-dehydroquinate synthase [Candidatus Omnitrophica bacterium]|nr:3-dehydroquinate synthase [Candidatus Omnitrophota bacterium]